MIDAHLAVNAYTVDVVKRGTVPDMEKQAIKKDAAAQVYLLLFLNGQPPVHVELVLAISA